MARSEPVTVHFDRRDPRRLLRGGIPGPGSCPELADGVPVKVVSQPLGHAGTTITLTPHVHPDMGRQAADRHAALLDG